MAYDAEGFKAISILAEPVTPPADLFTPLLISEADPRLIATGLNLERFNTLCERLWNVPRENFNMGVWSGKLHDPTGHPDIDVHNYNSISFQQLITHECGCVACIGGWTEALFGQEELTDGGGDEYASALLGISYSESVELFYPANIPSNRWAAITSRQAVRVIQNFIRCGEVSWTAGVMGDA